MKIYLVRHAETDSNVVGRSIGAEIDEPLNAEGISEAEDLAQKLPADFDVVFSSPLQRARQTAEIIAKKLKLPVVVRPELIERDMGTLGGLPWKEIDALPGEKDHGHRDYSPWGGDSVEDVRARLSSFANFVKEKYADKKVLAVSHGGVIRVMRSLFGQQPPSQPDNLSIHEIEI